ncbi:MAG TPA: ABC transporter substrate-binding protein, partial [Methylomirabilota bacterium]|nr:ABC transporter substrate-binding protein [Methylomirabilota bacterium]
RLPQLVEELINLKVDIIISVGPPVTRAAKKAGSSIPIVMIAGSGDPVAEALIASLARPGGTLTGLTAVPLELYFDKRLELLKETVPKISRVAVLWDQSMRPIGTRPLEPAGASLKIQLRELEVRSPSELEGAFKSIAREGAGAVLILESPMLFTYRTRLAELALKGRLPAISVFREFAEAGGLMTYGPSLIDQWRRAATYVDKILRGAKPADLPVEQPTRFELVINLKTANALGLTIPRSILIRADQVIQ